MPFKKKTLNSCIHKLIAGFAMSSTVVDVAHGQGFPSSGVIELSSLNGTEANSTSGLAINGISRGDRSGYSVSNAGDVNGDGLDDLIVGAPGVDRDGYYNFGQVYVIFGDDTDGFPNDGVIALSSLATTNPDIAGLVINGIDGDINVFGVGDRLGNSVSNAGDVNGDGVDDLLIAARSASPNGNRRAGESYVLFGNSTDDFPSDRIIDLSSLTTANPDVLGLTINGIDENDFASRVSNAGDVNNDGFDDLLIGALGADPNGINSAGETYIIFGSNMDGFPGDRVIELSTLTTTNPDAAGLVINGIDENDTSGSSISAAGDINNDGFDDFLIGAPSASPDGNFDAGQIYVIFGANADNFPADRVINLSSLASASPDTNGLLINGINSGDRLGTSVSNAGDINGDGVDDLFIGAASAEPNGITSAGQSYVIFGNSTGNFPSDGIINLSSLITADPDVSGLILNGIDRLDFTGREVSNSGDVNGDGVDDLLIGVEAASPNDILQAGEAYVIFGSSTGDFPVDGVIELSSLGTANPHVAGLTINGINIDDLTGSSVSTAGDINGDGVDDLLISAIRSDPYGINEAGSTYVVFGSDAFFIDSFELE